MIDLVFDPLLRGIAYNFFLVLSLVYFWGSLFVDTYIMLKMDVRMQQGAFFFLILHLFFIMIITSFVFRHLS